MRPLIPIIPKPMGQYGHPNQNNPYNPNYATNPNYRQYTPLNTQPALQTNPPVLNTTYSRPVNPNQPQFDVNVNGLQASPMQPNLSSTYSPQRQNTQLSLNPNFSPDGGMNSTYSGPTGYPPQPRPMLNQNPNMPQMNPMMPALNPIPQPMPAPIVQQSNTPPVNAFDYGLGMAINPFETEEVSPFSLPDEEQYITFKDETKTEIKACTMPKLVEKMTTNIQLIDNESFFLTYKSFCTTQELLPLLFKRYHFEFHEFDDIRAVRHRVLSFFEQWIDKFTVDFYNAGVAAEIAAFVETILKDDPNNQLAAVVQFKINKLSKPREPVEKIEEAITDEFFPSAFEYPSLDIAQQIMNIEWELWEKIKIEEFLDLNWTKKDKESLAPYVTKMSSTFNEMSDKYATLLCTAKKLKDRVKVLCKLLEIAEFSKDMGNFNGFMEIYSTLQRGPIRRLKKTFAALPEKERLMYESHKTLVECTNHMNIRALMKELTPPIIPYLGMYLSDILFVSQGSADQLNGMINVMKMTRNSEIFKQIKMYQQHDSKVSIYPPNLPLQSHLQNIPSLNEEVLYEISYYIEPRDGKEMSGKEPAELTAYLRDNDVASKATKGTGVSRLKLTGIGKLGGGGKKQTARDGRDDELAATPTGQRPPSQPYNTAQSSRSLVPNAQTEPGNSQTGNLPSARDNSSNSQAGGVLRSESKTTVFKPHTPSTGSEAETKRDGSSTPTSPPPISARTSSLNVRLKSASQSTLSLPPQFSSATTSEGLDSHATNSTDGSGASEAKRVSGSFIGRRDRDDEKSLELSTEAAPRLSTDSISTPTSATNTGGTNTPTQSAEALGRSRKTLVSSEREKKKGSGSGSSRRPRVDEKEKMEAAEKALEKTGLAPSPRFSSPSPSNPSSPEKERERDATPGKDSLGADMEGGETPRRGRSRRDKRDEEQADKTSAGKVEVREDGNNSENRESSSRSKNKSAATRSDEKATVAGDEPAPSPRKNSTADATKKSSASSATSSSAKSSRTRTIRDNVAKEGEEEKKG